ncbi:MAG: hypothetical protein P8129_23300 [Anaerolineae bacterium]
MMAHSRPDVGRRVQDAARLLSFRHVSLLLGWFCHRKDLQWQGMAVVAARSCLRLLQTFAVRHDLFVVVVHSAWNRNNNNINNMIIKGHCKVLQ